MALPLLPKVVSPKRSWEFCANITAVMGKLILEYEGTLERFTGDGMMIFFNDPVVIPNPAERALRMAVVMRDRVKEISLAWRKSRLRSLGRHRHRPGLCHDRCNWF